jgi:lipoprotein-anchoring transpeptidase ErfK/SrfK
VRDLDVRYGQVWVRMNGAVRLSRTRWRITIDRSARRLSLTHGKPLVRRVRVSVGAPGTPTPLGSYHVTEKLAGAGEYGCCIIAISGVQPDIPTGWQGGNQLAIHGTDTPSLIGSATSTGCLRASDADLRAIARRVRPGTPVRIVS